MDELCYNKGMSCPYCGDAPVNHAVQYVSSTLDLFFERLVPASRPLVIRLLERFLMRLGLVLGFVRASDELRGGSKRTKVVWDEAERRGIRIEQLTVFGKRGDDCRALLPARKGDGRLRFHYFQSIPVPPWLSEEAAWVNDKRSFTKRFRQSGLPVAEGFSVCTQRGARHAWKTLGGPVIVKPRSGSRARHTSVNVTTEDDLRTAFARAKEICAFVVIESCIPGDTYRLACVGGTLVAALHFVKPRIAADGRSTCDELLERYNEVLPPGVRPVKRNVPYLEALRHQGLAPDSIPAAGTLLTLAEHSERANGGYNEDITDAVPEHVRQKVERAARLAGLAVIGFDIISRDLTDAREPFTFIEGNPLPFIDIHHDPTVGKPRDVAGAVWDLWEVT